ncbi:TlpA disulfide reductase family protein [Dyella sp. C9]|uniref:TlpA family protein disulfide reductase n=1 Tax=Dyella sp. C9 TaxID=2202154 RepID=UPI001300224B|nr:TlpA disulfide reductase family protein [Dyella sp. C9]
MRGILWLASLAATLPLASHAAPASADESRFVATLQLGPSPQVRYLDAAGKSIGYAAFAQQLGQGRDYSITRDTQAGMAVLRLRPAEAPAGRFAFGRGDAFPPFELPSLQGKLQRLGDFRGRYTLVSFFFAECVPCIAEVPTLNVFAREHGDMNFVAITYEDAATAGMFVRLRGLRWNVLHDGQALIDTLGVGVYPTLMLIDPAGRVAGAAVGMTLQDDRNKRLSDLDSWIVQWKRAASAARP